MSMTLGSLFAGIGGFDLGFERAGFKTLWQCEIDKAAQGVLRRHFPDAKLHSDVREVGAHNLEPVDVLTFGSPCFPAGVLVLTRRGLIPIEGVVVGDEVVSHLGRWQPVVRVGSKIAPTLRLKGQGHPGLITTEEHPFWASTVGRKWNNDLRQCRREFGPLEWMPAKDMQGRMWSSLMEFPASAVPPMLLDKWETSCPAITPELMWVVGSWVGDGWVRDAKREGRENSHWGNVFIADGKGAPSEEVRKRLQVANLTFWESDERTTTRFVVSSAPFARWLTTHFGRYAEGKTIPAWLLGAPLEMREAFLQGYLFADGSKLKGKGYRMTSVSKRLTFGIAMLIRCTRPSESVSVYWTAAHEGRQIEGRPIKERESWQAHAHLEARSSLVIDGYRMGLVRECAPTGVEERVYNIEVEGDHSYTADGIIVHNCQDLSVAGKRAGLAGNRSGLFHEAARIIRELREQHGKPDFAIWENVPGAFSSNGGRDFAAVVQTMVDLGARDVCWRVLDSRYFGVAQRRRRVFLVADFGGERAKQILFEPESLRGDTAKGRKTRKEAPAGIGAGAQGGGESFRILRTDEYRADTVASTVSARDYKSATDLVVPFDTTQITSPYNYSTPKAGDPCHPLAAGAIAQPISFHPTQDPISSQDGTSHAMPNGSRAGQATIAVAFDLLGSPASEIAKSADVHTHLRARMPGQIENSTTTVAVCAIGFDATSTTADAMIEAHPVLRGVKGGNASHHTGVAVCATGEMTHTLTCTAGKGATEDGTGRGVPLDSFPTMQVRRLVPQECESLQGFPRNWTAEACLPDGTIKQQADGPRYKQLGNAVTVNVAEWIAHRLVTHFAP